MTQSTDLGLFEDETLEERNGRLCRWVPDPSDELFGGTWEPVDAEPVATPKHKEAARADDNYVRKHTAEFRKRAKELLKERGYLVYPVDRWNFAASKTFDLFGLFDMEAFRPSPCLPGSEETVMVQLCAKSGLGSHITKMCAHEPVGKLDKTWRSDYLRKFLESGRLVLLLGYYKGSNGRWLAEERWLTMEVLNAHEPRRNKRQ